MKTNRPNWDYEKTIAITPQLVKLCDQCGAPMVNRYEVFHCSGCRSTTFEVLYDNQAETFRRGLAEKQYESSIFLAASQRCSLDATENDMDELHRWFSEAEPTLAEQITDEIMRDAAWLDTEPTDAQLRDIEAENESTKISNWLDEEDDEDDDLEIWEQDFDDAVEHGFFPMDTEPRKPEQPKDPRTPTQRDLDSWQADASATRRMDEPR